ncbi:hypothetical protein T08_5357 [Trichinella sp. T8]|nr:hypothetical protein T08_5357 [Trichinella sp. T8]
MAKSITLMRTGQRGSSENMAKLRCSIQYAISSEHAISKPPTAQSTAAIMKNVTLFHVRYGTSAIGWLNQSSLKSTSSPDFEANFPRIRGKFDIKRTHARSFLHDIRGETVHSSLERRLSLSI